MNKKAVVNQADAFWQEPFAAASFISYGRFGQSVLYDGRMEGVCMDILEDSTSVERALFERAEKKKIPLYGILELLPLCNMNCDMCYVRMSREEM